MNNLLRFGVALTSLLSVLAGITAFVGSTVNSSSLLGAVSLLLYVYVAWPAAVVAGGLALFTGGIHVRRMIGALFCLLFVLPFIAEGLSR